MHLPDWLKIWQFGCARRMFGILAQIAPAIISKPLEIFLCAGFYKSYNGTHHETK